MITSLLLSAVIHLSCGRGTVQVYESPGIYQCVAAGGAGSADGGQYYCQNHYCAPPVKP